MKKLLLITALASIASASFGQLFSDGTLIVLSTGRNTTGGATGVGTTATLLNFALDGSAVMSGLSQKSFSLGSDFVVSNSATSEAGMQSSANFLAVAGYRKLDGQVSVNSTATAATRSVAVFDNMANSGAGGVSYVDIGTVYGNNNIRGGFTANGSTVFTAGNGSNAGWRTGTSSSTSQIGTTTNTRVIKQVGGSLFGSTGSGTTGIYALDPSQPTAAAQQALIASSASPFDFDFFSTGGRDFLFVADDSSGLGVFEKISGTWTFQKSYVASNLRSIAVRQTNTGVDIYGVLGFSSTLGSVSTLNKISLSNGQFGTSSATFGSALATAADGTAFRSVEIVPEPASMAVLGLGILGLARRRRNK